MEGFIVVFLNINKFSMMCNMYIVTANRGNKPNDLFGSDPRENRKFGECAIRQKFCEAGVT